MSNTLRHTAAILLAAAFFLTCFSPPMQGAEISPYGVCAHVSRHGDHELAEQEFALMRQAGIRWARTDFDWTTVQPRQGEWDFSMLDATVEKAEAAGIEILPILGYDVRWARPAYKHLDAWLAYVRRTVSRYKDRLRYWEVWNEQDLEQFWKETPNPANYTILLKATFREIKKIDPDLQVLIGGMSGIPYDYIEGVYEAGGAFFDIMAVHPYRYPLTPESRPLADDLNKLRALMTQYGDASKPIWITEIGWPTHQNRSALLEAIVRTGLRAADPNRDDWTVAVLDDGPARMPFSETTLHAMLPGDGRMDRIPLNRLDRLSPTTHQALLMTPSENFAVEAFDAIEAYVRAGGIVIFTQGVPLYYAARRDAAGRWTQEGADESFRRRLHIGWQAWWTQDGVPKRISTLRTAEQFASDIRLPTKTPAGDRFLTDTALQDGDRMNPLVQAIDGDFTGTVAAVYDLDSDLKGAVIVSTLAQDFRGISEIEQAAILPRTYLIALHSGVERMFWYNFRARENDPTYNEDHFGIVHSDLAAKPAFIAMQTLNRARPAGSVPLDSDRQTKEMFHPGWRRPDGQTAWALWTPDGSRSIRITVEGTIMDAYDALGKPLELQASAPSIEITTGETPIYLIGPEKLTLAGHP